MDNKQQLTLAKVSLRAVILTWLGFVFLAFGVPMFGKIFENMGAGISLPLRILILASELVRNFGFFALPFLLLATVASSVWLGRAISASRARNS